MPGEYRKLALPFRLSMRYDCFVGVAAVRRRRALPLSGRSSAGSGPAPGPFGFGLRRALSDAAGDARVAAPCAGSRAALLSQLAFGIAPADASGT